MMFYSIDNYYYRGTCYTDSSRRTKGVESISAQIMDLHTDVADLDAKECFLDRMIEGCRAELKNLTEDPEVSKYPFNLASLVTTTTTILFFLFCQEKK